MKQPVLKDFKWMNKPKKFVVHHDRVIVETEPETDFWQRTHYGFQHDNAPALVTEIAGDFTFQVKVEFEEISHRYDQCGALMFIDSENWIKVSVEYENENFARLGSVVTNLGFSDWASTDISAGISAMWYRISRRGQDFFIENSVDGIAYHQMRMPHMHKLTRKVQVGVYACSPLRSGYNAVFSEFKVGPCMWPEYINHE